jgi:hypothetical protein
VDYFMPVSNSDVEWCQHATWGTEENHENLHLNYSKPWKNNSRVSHEVAEFRTRAPRNIGPCRYHNSALLGQDCSVSVFRPNNSQTRTSKWPIIEPKYSNLIHLQVTIIRIYIIRVIKWQSARRITGRSTCLWPRGALQSLRLPHTCAAILGTLHCVHPQLTYC